MGTCPTVIRGEGGPSDLSLKPQCQLLGDLIHDVSVELPLSVQSSPVEAL